MRECLRLLATAVPALRLAEPVGRLPWQLGTTTTTTTTRNPARLPAAW